jgi:hypothetical protein
MAPTVAWKQTLEGKWDIFLEKISTMIGKELYRPDGNNENKDVKAYGKPRKAAKKRSSGNILNKPVKNLR